MSSANSFEGTLAVIGGGKMGEAIVRGLLASATVDASRVTVAEPAEARRTELVAEYGIRCVADGAEALPADVTILAVKPQVMDAVVTTLSASLATSVVVSIAAGITTARLESLLPAGTSVVRVMPNTPAMVGEGMAVVSGGSDSTAAQVETVRAMFESLGQATIVDEKLQDACTAISGSGPAYFALVIDALSRAGVAQGLSRDLAQQLAVQTMLGTAVMIRETGQHPEALIDGVTSPGGTTIAAITELEKGRVRSAFAAAVDAAVRRAKELGS